MCSYRFGRILPLLPLLTLLLASPLLAAEWLPVTSEELQLTSEPKAPGATAIYLYRQVDRDDTSSEEFVYSRLKILNQEGRKYADVEIPYAKGDESIYGIDARTIRPDGSIVRFDGTIYDKPLMSGRSVKVMAKTFTMPEAEVGSIIEFRYRHAQNRWLVFDSHWILSQELFTRHAKFSLTPSPYFLLRWSWPRGLPDGTSQPANEHGKIRLETHNVPAFVTEELMPPENELKYRVDFVYYDESRSNKDEAKYWKSVGKDAFRDIERFVDRKKAMERTVAQIVQPDDSPETKLRKIYARVQGLQNDSYRRRRTEQEIKREEQAHNVEDVWVRGSGSATQLNQLFIALVRAAGLPASSVLVPTRNEYFFNPSLMNERQLNSNLVLVSLPGKDWFFDAGVPFTPFGQLPWYETAVKALQLDSSGGKWIATLLPASADARIERKAQLKLEPGGALAGTVTLRFSGFEAAWRRMQERNEDAVDRKEFLESQLRSIVPSGIEVKLTNTPDWSAWEEPLVAVFDLQIPGWVASAGQRELLRVGVFGAAEDHRFVHQTRTHPIYFDFPYEYSDDVTIELPRGKHISSLPKPRALDFGAYSYNLVAEEKNGALRLQRNIKMATLLVNVTYYDQLRAFFQSVKTADEEQVVIAPLVAQR